MKKEKLYEEMSKAGFKRPRKRPIGLKQTGPKPITVLEMMKSSFGFSIAFPSKRKNRDGTHKLVIKKIQAPRVNLLTKIVRCIKEHYKGDRK